MVSDPAPRRDHFGSTLSQSPPTRLLVGSTGCGPGARPKAWRQAGQSRIKPSCFVRLNRGQVQEPLNSQPDVWGAHQYLANKDGRDPGSLKPLHVTTGLDAAFTDYHDPGRDLVAESKSVLNVGAELP